MSTDSLLPKAGSGEMPASSSTSTSSWSQFGNGNNVGDELMALRKRNVSQNQSQADSETEINDNNSSFSQSISPSSSSGVFSSSTTTISLDDGLNSAVNPSGPSPTSYSFSGSALGSDGVANLKDKLPDSQSTTENSTNSENSPKNTNSSSTNNNANNEDRPEDSMYECNICLDTAKDAVVSMCGHLFCWPCLHQWLETRPNRMLCPVCKAAISKEKVIPLYGRNSDKQEDPRNKVPPRPAGQRTEPEPQTGFPGFGFGDGGFHMSFGIGAFPFGYFASSFNFGEPRPGPANRGTAHYEDEQQLSKLFLYLAFLCIAWLLFA